MRGWFRWAPGCGGSEAEFALAAGVGPEGVDVVRRRTLGDGMTEEILLANESGVAVEVRVELECAADFRDIFELRGSPAVGGAGGGSGGS